MKYFFLHIQLNHSALFGKRVQSLLIVLFAASCSLLTGPDEFHDIEAEILEISKRTDSSANVLVSILSPGNAYRCSLFVVYDTIPINVNSTSAYNKRKLVLDLNPCAPVEKHEFVAVRMRLKRTYYFQLVQLSYFEIKTAGPASSRYNAIGKEQQFEFR